MRRRDAAGDRARPPPLVAPPAFAYPVRPMDVQQILAEAERHALAGDVLRADVLVQDVLRHHPEHAEALYMAGMFQSHIGNPAVAEGLLKRAVAADPKFEIAYASLG